MGAGLRGVAHLGSSIRAGCRYRPSVTGRKRPQTTSAVGLSVLAHGLSAAPLANRYARWYEQHPHDKAPPLESTPTDATRARGPAAELTEVGT